MPKLGFDFYISPKQYLGVEWSGNYAKDYANDCILCFPPNKILFLTLLLTVAFQEFRLFSIHSFLLHLSVDTFVFLIILFL